MLLRGLLVLLLGAGVPCLALPSAGAKPAYRISGVVLSKRTGSPVPFLRLDAKLGSSQASANFDLQSPASRGMGVRGAMRHDGPQVGRTERGWENEVVADEHGRFRLELPSAGAWQLTAAGHGFHRQHFDEHEEYFSSIVLTEVRPTAEVTFRVDPDATISGLVLDEAGEAVQGAQVWVEFARTEGEEMRRERRQAGGTQTDDRGRYEMPGLAPGSYVLKIQAQPWYAQRLGVAGGASRLDPPLDVVYETLWYPGAPDPRGAETIRLSGGEEREADFHLAAMPAAHLRLDPVGTPGQVIDGDVGSRARRSMALTRLAPEGGFSQTTYGDYADFGGLVPGIYRLEVRGADGRVEREVRQFRVLPGATGAVDLSSAAVLTQVKVSLDAAEKTPGSQVIFIDKSTGLSVTADGGNRVFGQGLKKRPGVDYLERNPRERAAYLAPGTYEVTLGGQGPNYVTGLEATGASVSGLLITVGSSPASVTVKVASDKGQVSGVVKMGGNAVEGAMVLLVPALLGQPGNVSGIERDQTNSDGSFRLEGVIPGEYILLAIDQGWNVRWDDVQTLARYLAHGVPLEVGAGSRLVRSIGAVVP